MTEQEIHAESLILDNPNLKALIDKLRRLDNVSQVRYWTVLKKRLRTTAGDDAVTVNVFVKEDLKPDTDMYIQLSSIVPSVIWNDLGNHELAIQNTKDAIAKYYETGIIPAGY